MKKRNPYLNDRDILDNALEHSWGKSAEAKAKERAYNREYYQRHKEELLRKARSNVENAFNNVRDYGEKLKKDFRTSANITSRGLTDRIIEESRSYLNKNGANILKKDPEVVRQLKERGYSDKDIDNYYKYARNSTIARGAARNERAKAARQNSPVERVKRDLRRTTAGARSNVENTFNNARSAVEDAGRYLEKTYKDTQTRSQQRKQAKGYKLMSDLSAIPQRLTNRMIPDGNERNEYYRNNPDTRAELNKLGQYRRQYGTAANEAAKASMTRAQKEALKKREEAKRRMQKWFKR